MAIFRVQKTQNYTVLSNYHFKEKTMSLKAKGLLSLMLSLPDNWNYTIAGLVTLSKDGKDSVMSALGELESFGYLERKRTTNEKGQFSGIEYFIFEQAQPITEKPILDNTKAEKALAETPPQLNTKQLKTKFNKVLKETNKYKEENYLDILAIVSDDRLRGLYLDFLENRQQAGAPLNRKGLMHLLERVREIAGIDTEKQIEIVRNAVINNWRNVYPIGEIPKEESADLKRLKEWYS